MASNSKNIAELLNNVTTLDAADIASGAIAADELATGAVTSAKIDTGAVTTAKLASGAVTEAKWGGGQIGGRRNIIINGDFQIAQRATSVSSTDGSNEDYTTVDRWFWRFGNNAPGTCTISQDSDVPSGYGFAKSWKFDVTATGTATGDHHTLFSQFIEARSLRNSGWDYTNPSSYVTLSFWVKSTKTGTYCVAFDAVDVGGNFKFIKEYTINSASTWEKKTISIPGHASLVFADDAERGCELGWNFASGGNRDNATDNTWWTTDASRVTSNQVNFFDDTANDYWITGVQLEVGDTATPFEHRSYGEELALCQRYYNSMNTHYLTYYTSTSCISDVTYPVSMRANPTITIGSNNNLSIVTGGAHPTGHYFYLTSAANAYYASSTSDAEL